MRRARDSIADLHEFNSRYLLPCCYTGQLLQANKGTNRIISNTPRSPSKTGVVTPLSDKIQTLSPADDSSTPKGQGVLSALMPERHQGKKSTGCFAERSLIHQNDHGEDLVCPAGTCVDTWDGNRLIKQQAHVIYRSNIFDSCRDDQTLQTRLTRARISGENMRSASPV